MSEPEEEALRKGWSALCGDAMGGVFWMEATSVVGVYLFISFLCFYQTYCGIFYLS